MSKTKVVVDVDAGSDDAIALLMLMSSADVEILGITCVHGNTDVDNVCTNVLQLLETVDRLDIPVYRGAEHPLISSDFAGTSSNHRRFHGEDGFGDVRFPKELSKSKVDEEGAVSAINTITSQPAHRGKVTLVCLGPLTNIALAIRTYPGLSKNVKDMFIMGGNSTGMGNVTSAAEFNFYNDPEAAHIVLSSAHWPINLLPWETCVDIPLSMEWRFGILGAIGNKQMALLNAVEKSIYERLARTTGPNALIRGTTYYTCDPIVTAVLLRPDIVTKSRHVHLSIELNGHRTRGQAVIDHLSVHKPNVRLIEGINVDLLKEMLILAAGH